MDDLYKQAIKETTEIVYDCLKKTDEMNRRLLMAIIIMTISFSLTIITMASLYFTTDYDYATIENSENVEVNK